MTWENFFVMTIYCLGGFFVIVLIFWKFYFLRDPNRNITSGDNIISPADGKVLEIFHFNLKDETMIKKGKYGKIITLLSDTADKGYVISIFMSPLNVHINRAPIQGKIVYQKHTPGKFNVAYDFWNTLENEKNEIIINGKFKIKVIQISGILARRIECFVSEGEHVVKGQRIGLINLGSQVTLIIPEKLKPIVKKGDIVRAGETIIAKF